jgi:hypothetical protein
MSRSKSQTRRKLDRPVWTADLCRNASTGEIWIDAAVWNHAEFSDPGDFGPVAMIRLCDGRYAHPEDCHPSKIAALQAGLARLIDQSQKIKDAIRSTSDQISKEKGE